jgi:hypothetical protein
MILQIFSRRFPQTRILMLLSVVAVAGLPGIVAPTRAQADGAQSGAATTDSATTDKDQTELSVTVYNSDLALVRDVRKLELPTGAFRLRFEDVAATINPVTVHLRSLNEAERLSVIEQDYEYDLLDPQKLMHKYVGREVTLVREEEENNSTKWTETKALLLSDNNDAPVWKIGNEIVTGLSRVSYRFPDLPENLYSRPTLIWSLENRGAKAQQVEASYLMTGMSWKADYVLTVGRDEKQVDLDGWVTVVNNAGTAFPNAKLQLVAGEVHRVVAKYPRAMASQRLATAMVDANQQFEQENFSEYHLYTLGRRTSLENAESKQISLLNGTNVPVEKILRVNGNSAYFRNAQTIGEPVPEPVMVFYKFKNSSAAGLGMPLPAGTIRVYQADSKGGTQFAGEDYIAHTPKDEDVSIHVGDAFDVVAERKQMDWKKVADRLHEIEYQIAIRNHKDTPITVQVREPVGGDWEMLNSTFPAKKLDSSTIQFEIPVAKNDSATLDYRIRVHW